MNAKNDIKITKIFFAIDAIRYEENRFSIIDAKNIYIFYIISAARGNKKLPSD